MKILFQIVAVLLLWIFIACNNPKKGQSSADEKSKAVTVQDLKLEEVTLQDTKTVPAPVTQLNKFTPSKIVSDGKAIPDNEEKSSNTEDYDHITDNRFLTDTQNPLSTFSI